MHLSIKMLLSILHLRRLQIYVTDSISINKRFQNAKKFIECARTSKAGLHTIWSIWSQAIPHMPVGCVQFWSISILDFIFIFLRTTALINDHAMNHMCLKFVHSWRVCQLWVKIINSWQVCQVSASLSTLGEFVNSWQVCQLSASLSTLGKFFNSGQDYQLSARLSSLGEFCQVLESLSSLGKFVKSRQVLSSLGEFVNSG
jgi:hypothetical protein